MEEPQQSHTPHLDTLDLASCSPGWYAVTGTHTTVYLFQVRPGAPTRIWRTVAERRRSPYDQECGTLIRVRTTPEAAPPEVILLGHRHLVEWDPGPLSPATQWRLATEVTRVERVTPVAAEALRAQMPLDEQIEALRQIIATGGHDLAPLRRAVLTLARTVRETAKGGGPYAPDAETRALCAWRAHVTSHRMDLATPLPLYRCGQQVARWAHCAGRGSLEEMAHALLVHLPSHPHHDPAAPFPQAVGRAYTVVLEGGSEEET